MTWLAIDAVLLMLACFAVGSLMAWLLAVAVYPKASEAFTDIELDEGDA